MTTRRGSLSFWAHALDALRTLEHTNAMTIESDKPSPIEVWLTRQHMTTTCRVVRQDESTEEIDVDSLSMRGAQREITGWLIKVGYTPVGRWNVEQFDDNEGEAVETARTFKIA